MKKLLLAGILLATPAYADWKDRAADTVHHAEPWQDHSPRKPAPEPKSTGCQYWNCRDQENWEKSPFEYTEATLANSPPWMKLNCHKREHRWALRYHSYTMCR
jgi:hypothetical protein